MKTSLVSLFTTVLIGSAIIASGRLIDAATFVAIAFSAGLVAWTMAQYRTQPRALTRSRPVFLPARKTVSCAMRPTLQRAA